ncbi:MAG TPA: hypothetical protein DD730_05430, partial [Desulfosporosinus sp.]|nr:hypothetical protein [Desulfosporosinus sp.]
IHYLTADEEEQYVVAQANAPLDKEGKFLGEKIDGRHGADFVHVSPNHVDYMDVSPKQMVSIATALIPFL